VLVRGRVFGRPGFAGSIFLRRRRTDGATSSASAIRRNVLILMSSLARSTRWMNRCSKSARAANCSCVSPSRVRARRMLAAMDSRRGSGRGRGIAPRVPQSASRKHGQICRFRLTWYSHGPTMLGSELTDRIRHASKSGLTGARRVGSAECHRSVGAPVTISRAAFASAECP
jgi:hypothetical protein